MTDTISPALCDVIAERVRQQHGEGWTPAHDDAHAAGELAQAAAAYALSGSPEPSWRAIAGKVWPFEAGWFKPLPWKAAHAFNRRRVLVKAAALLIAEIERLDRAACAAYAALPRRPIAPATCALENA